MSLLIEILITLLVLSVLVIGHEFGHYAAGRLLKFDILEFAVGMGPRLCGFKKNGIEYNLRLFPIGGMCRFSGEDETPSEEGSFRAKAAWKRAVVVFAGPFMNFVLAFVISMILYMGWGTYDPGRVIVQSLNVNGPAETAGLLPGDELTAVNGARINSIESLSNGLNSGDPGRVTITVLRGGEQKEYTFAPVFDETEQKQMIGVTITNPIVKDSFFAAVPHSLRFCWEMGTIVFKSLGMLFTGEAGLNDMSGVVGVTRIVGEAASYGMDMLLTLCVMLSMNLGIMNLLPVPALDGGRLFFILVEMVRRKPVPAEKEGLVHLIGLALLMVLMIYLVVHDITVWVGA